MIQRCGVVDAARALIDSAPESKPPGCTAAAHVHPPTSATTATVALSTAVRGRPTGSPSGARVPVTRAAPCGAGGVADGSLVGSGMRTSLGRPACTRFPRASPPWVPRARQDAGMTIRVGTSGWTYDSWAGPFYPKGVARRRWLEFYAERLETVELNASHYRWPRDTAFTAGTTGSRPGSSWPSRPRVR